MLAKDYIVSIVAEKVRIWYRDWKQKTKQPMFLGICGPPGSGKTTLANNLRQTLTDINNIRVVVVSLDDFYLPHSQQCDLSSRFQDNPLLRYRGNPGTHSTDLLTEVCEQLRSGAVGAECSLPVFDKSLNQGRGDRLPINSWSRVLLPVDVVIFEGTFVGAFADEITVRLSSELVVINGFLRNYEKAFSFLTHFIMLESQQLSSVCEWRTQQEHGLAQAYPDRVVLSDLQVQDFVDRFLPVLTYYYPRIIAKLAEAKPYENYLRLVLDQGRNIKAIYPE